MRTVDVIVDRLVRGKETQDRRLDSIETALARGMGRCRLILDSGSSTFVRGWRCSQCGSDHLQPQSNLFRYSSALGTCPRCEGVGQVVELDRDRIIPDPSTTIRKGAIAPWNHPAHRRLLQDLIERSQRLGIPVDVPFAELTAGHVQVIFEGNAEAGFPGLRGFFDRLERRVSRLPVQVFLSRYRRHAACPQCQGGRLRPEALAVRIEGQNIAEFSALSVGEARRRLEQWVPANPGEAAGRIVDQIRKRLDYLGQIGLDYLSLDRSARSLSGGELRRAIMAKTLGAGLVNTLYVLDEPTIGLHQHEVGRLMMVLNRLRDAGNTLVVVEHEHDLISAADHVVDLGPGAGESGGQLLYSGPVGPFREVKGSLTGDFLTGRKRVEIPRSRRQPSRGWISLKAACGHNLKAIDVAFPLGVLCVVSGVSGEGKSTLVEQTLYPAPATAASRANAYGAVRRADRHRRCRGRGVS